MMSMNNNYKINFKPILKLSKKLGLKIFIDGSHKQAEFKPAVKLLRRHGVIGTIIVPSSKMVEIATDQNKAMWYLATEILHELGHFIVAAPYRRSKKDYGIPSNGTRNPEFWEFEELKAVLVERKLCELFGIKTKGRNPLNHLYYFFQYKYKARQQLRKWWREVGEEQTLKVFKKGIV